MNARTSAVLVLALALQPALACTDDSATDSADSFASDTEAGDEVGTSESETGSSDETTDDGTTDETTDDDTTDGTTDDETTDSETTDEDTTDETTTEDDTTDGTTEDGTTTTESETGDDCIECSITLDTTQSGSLESIDNNTFLAEMYLGQEIVYALDEVGPGRVIYTGDSNILNSEITDCPLYEWLGQTDMQLPSLASIGSNLCSGIGNNLPNYQGSWTFLGESLPNQYVGDPAALAADYDVVIYCPVRFNGAPLTLAESGTYVDFVTQQGGGLYLVSEYFGGGIDQQAVDNINSIANPLDANFLPTNLNWGQADGEVMIDCFPNPQ